MLSVFLSCVFQREEMNNNKTIKPLVRPKMFQQCHLIHRFVVRKHPWLLQLFLLASFPIQLCGEANATLIRTCLQELWQQQDDCESDLVPQSLVYWQPFSQACLQNLDRIIYQFVVRSSILTERDTLQSKETMVLAGEMSEISSLVILCTTMEYFPHTNWMRLNFQFLFLSITRQLALIWIKNRTGATHACRYQHVTLRYSSYGFIHYSFFTLLSDLRYHISLERRLPLILTTKPHNGKCPMSSGSAMNEKIKG